MEWIRDRFARTIDPADLTAIDRPPRRAARDRRQLPPAISVALWRFLRNASEAAGLKRSSPAS